MIINNLKNLHILRVSTQNYSRSPIHLSIDLQQGRLLFKADHYDEPFNWFNIHVNCFVLWCWKKSNNRFNSEIPRHECQLNRPHCNMLSIVAVLAILMNNMIIHSVYFSNLFWVFSCRVVRRSIKFILDFPLSFAGGQNRELNTLPGYPASSQAPGYSSGSMTSLVPPLVLSHGTSGSYTHAHTPREGN